MACQLALPSTLSPSQRARLTAVFARAAGVTGAPPVKVSLEADLPLAVGLASSAAGLAVLAVARRATAGLPSDQGAASLLEHPAAVAPRTGVS